jgi:hypothetical protein
MQSRQSGVYLKEIKMKLELETTITNERGDRVTVCEWDDGGAWLHLQLRGCSASTTLSRTEAEQILAGLQAILAKEVTA